MKCALLRLGCGVLVFMACSTASAGEIPSSQPATGVSAVLSFVDDSTFFVLACDGSRLNLPGCEQWLDDVMDSAKVSQRELAQDKKEWAESFEDASQWLRRLHQCGVTRFYVVGRVTEFLEPQIFALVPVDEPARIHSIVNALNAPSAATGESPSASQAEIIRGLVAYGSTRTVQQLHSMRPPADRADFFEAFSINGGAPARLTVFASEKVRKTVLLGADQTGEGNDELFKLILRNVQKVVINLRPPPESSLDLTIVAAGHSAAVEMLNSFRKAKEAEKRDLEAATGQPMHLAFTVDGDRLVENFDCQQLRQQTIKYVLPRIIEWQRLGRRVQASLNERHLLAGILDYRTAHGLAWPEALDQVDQQVGGKAEFTKLLSGLSDMADPIHIIYLKPQNLDDADYSQRIIFFEAFDPHHIPALVSVGFADGHVDMLDKARLLQHAELTPFLKKQGIEAPKSATKQ